MAFTTPLAILPLPPPPAYLPTLPKKKDEYFLASQLVRNQEKDLFLASPNQPLPVDNRLAWPHLHLIRLAYVDDKWRRLCWHMRGIEKLLAPANSDYPGRNVYACHYLFSHPECDCKYREVDFHYERRVRKKQPLVAPTDWIIFPAGQGPEWLPPRRGRTAIIKRIWRQPDEVEEDEPTQAIDGDDMLVVQRVPQQAQLSASPDRPALVDVMHQMRTIQQQILNVRFNDEDRVQLLAHERASKEIHQLAVNASLPHVVTAEAVDVVLHNRVQLHNPRPGAQEAYAAARRTIVDEDNYVEEEWDTRLHQLLRWFRTDGLTFALPFVRECLDNNNNLFGAVVQDQIDRLFGALGRTPHDSKPARPEDDDGKHRRLDDAYQFITTQAHEPIVERFDANAKWVFLRDILALQELQDAYAAYQFPWRKILDAADEVIHLISATFEARDFDLTRLSPEMFKKGMQLVNEVYVLDSRDRAPWSGMGSGFASYGWTSR
ncbi:hypothetical protein CALVIDRAFT_560903 [Calocera viscosa TUFC12733]|uniref:Uncharacterized protein n=1 Tax=Calocera viscosa (strain TUFC12733) TaxID=1330018 RepID=A0A167Q9P7_CALVF|nr:hypothetical protein CALVIDRAFT_560903 [Calocera viscosa TUFC12733]